jgi:hypothetical protein
MPSNIDSQYTGPVALAFGSSNTELDGLADTSGASCDAIDVSGAVNPPVPTPPQVEILYKIKTGTTTPSGNTVVEFYFARAKSITGTDFATQNALAATFTTGNLMKSMLQFVHAQVVDTTASKEYFGSFIVDNPGPFWQLIIVNEMGNSAGFATGNVHDVSYRYISPEVQ